MLGQSERLGHFLHVGGGMHGFGMHGFGMSGFGVPHAYSNEFIKKLKEKYGDLGIKNSKSAMEMNKEKAMQAGVGMGMLTKVPLPADKQHKMNVAAHKEMVVKKGEAQTLINPLSATLAEGAMSGHGYAYATRPKGAVGRPKSASGVVQNVAADRAAAKRNAKATKNIRSDIGAILEAKERLQYGAGMHLF
jgi:hypothetical protein